MRKAWRLVRQSLLNDAFSGEGARLAGGRWNHRDVAVVYTSETLSLTVLEVFVHLTTIDVKFSLFSIPVEIPDSVALEELSQKDLPANWREEPPPDSIKDIGTDWYKKGKTAVLKVPSVIIPEEFNYIINPAHKDFRHIKIGKPQQFFLDPRMWKTSR